MVVQTRAGHRRLPVGARRRRQRRRPRCVAHLRRTTGGRRGVRRPARDALRARDVCRRRRGGGRSSPASAPAVVQHHAVRSYRGRCDRVRRTRTGSRHRRDVHDQPSRRRRVARARRVGAERRAPRIPSRAPGRRRRRHRAGVGDARTAVLARQWDEGFATLFTAAYRPVEGDAHLPLAGSARATRAAGIAGRIVHRRPHRGDRTRERGASGSAQRARRPRPTRAQPAGRPRSRRDGRAARRRDGGARLVWRRISTPRLYPGAGQLQRSADWPSAAQPMAVARSGSAVRGTRPTTRQRRDAAEPRGRRALGAAADAAARVHRVAAAARRRHDRTRRPRRRGVPPVPTATNLAGSRSSASSAPRSPSGCGSAASRRCRRRRSRSLDC